MRRAISIALVLGIGIYLLAAMLGASVSRIFPPLADSGFRDAFVILMVAGPVVSFPIACSARILGLEQTIDSVGQGAGRSHGGDPLAGIVVPLLLILFTLGSYLALEAIVRRYQVYRASKADRVRVAVTLAMLEQNPRGTPFTTLLGHKESPAGFRPILRYLLIYKLVDVDVETGRLWMSSPSRRSLALSGS